MYTVLRRYFSYEVLDHTEYLASLELTIKIRQQDFILLPVKTYTADLKVTDSKNNEMIILSDIEFENKYGVALSTLNNDYLSDVKDKVENPNEDILIEDHRLIAIAMKYTIDYQYEKIKISWKEKLNVTKSDAKFGVIEIPIYVIRYGVEGSSSLYVSISTKSEHLVLQKPRIRVADSTDEPEHVIIFDDTKEKIYRFSNASISQIIEIIIVTDVPRSIKQKIIISTFVGIVVTTYVAILSVTEHTIPRFSHEILLSVIGFLLGQRIFVSKNIPLIDEWNKTHIVLSIYAGFVLFLLITLEFYGILHYIDAPSHRSDIGIKDNIQSRSVMNLTERNDTLSITDSLIITVNSLFTHFLQ